MGARPQYELATNPFLVCSACEGPVQGRCKGRTIPCCCLAGVVSLCPSAPGLLDDCSCDLYAADALQEALESADARVLAGRRVDADRRVTEALQGAEAWRPGMTAWLLFAMAVGLIFAALETIR